MVGFPQKGLSKYQVIERWIAAEKDSGFDTFDRSFFVEGPKLVSSPDIPWADEVRHMAVESYNRFVYGEMWHCTGLLKMHDEVISMVGDLFGSGDATGYITTGGTESNFCALLAAKSRALSIGKLKPGRNGSIILPRTAHYSFFKACHIFDFRPVVINPLPGTLYEVNPQDVRKALKEDTIAIVATAGSMPFGNVDPIEELGKIAEEEGIYLHVDACFGGFILPFLERGNYPMEIPKWDFRVKSVCSIAADLHKDGMAPPPASCIIYRNKELLEFAKSILPPYGGITGTRGGGATAASWTMLNLLGIEGYIPIARKCMRLKEQIEQGVSQIPGLKFVPGSKVNLLVIYSDEFDLMPVIKELRRNGWVFRTATNPPPVGIVTIIMPQNESRIPAFLEELKKNMRLAEPIRSKSEMKAYKPDYPTGPY